MIDGHQTVATLPASRPLSWNITTKEDVKNHAALPLAPSPRVSLGGGQGIEVVRVLQQAVPSRSLDPGNVGSWFIDEACAIGASKIGSIHEGRVVGHDELAGNNTLCPLLCAIRLLFISLRL